MDKIKKMRFGQGFILGVRTYAKALELISHKRLRWFLLIPLLLNLFLLFGGYQLMKTLADNLNAYLFSLLNLENMSFFGSEYVDDFLGGGIRLLFSILLFLIIMYYGGFIIIVLLAPVFSFLSERVESLKTGIDYPFSLPQLGRDIFRGLCIAVRNFAMQLLSFLLVLLLGFIPIVGIFTPFLLFLLAAYFFGFSFLDYALERRNMSVKQSVAFMRKNKGVVIANGGLFSLSLMIPFCGMFLSSFVAIVSVVAGTLAVIEIWENRQD